MTIDPCIINSYDMQPILNTVEMTVGDPDATSEQYDFIQNQSCGYPETIKITGQPEFVVH